jgi:hypothetical protein
VALLSINSMISALIRAIFASLFSPLKSQRELTLENLALRQQVVMLKRSVERARPNNSGRLFWMAFSRFVVNRSEHAIAIQDTIVRCPASKVGMEIRCRRLPRPESPNSQS